jgi:hypothetical protein
VRAVAVSSRDHCVRAYRPACWASWGRWQVLRIEERGAAPARVANIVAQLLNLHSGSRCQISACRSPCAMARRNENLRGEGEIGRRSILCPRHCVGWPPPAAPGSRQQGSAGGWTLALAVPLVIDGTAARHISLHGDCSKSGQTMVWPMQRLRMVGGNWCAASVTS